MHPIRVEEIVPMKMLVVYDEQGDILSADLPSDIKSESIMLRQGKWLSVAEADISQVICVSQIETCQGDIPNLIENIANNFRIQQGKLVSRDS
jgi:hypothetical protein